MKGKSPLLFSEKSWNFGKKGMEKCSRGREVYSWSAEFSKYGIWMCRKLRLVSKKKVLGEAVGQVVKNLLYNLSSKFLMLSLLLLLFFLVQKPSFIPPSSLVCHSDAATIRQIAIFGKVVVHSMTRKLAFAHVISLKRGQDEWEFFDSIICASFTLVLCIIYSLRKLIQVSSRTLIQATICYKPCNVCSKNKDIWVRHVLLWKNEMGD